jgi:alpha-aminoadipic semialdehyde synthase
LKNLVQRELDGEMGIVAAIEKLGLLDDILVAKQGSPLDTLSHYLSKRLAFGIIIHS